MTTQQQQSWYTPGVYTPQNREAAYTLAQMGSWNQSQGRPFPIQSQPVSTTGQPKEWLGSQWYSPNPSTQGYRRKRRGGKSRKVYRKRSTRRANTRRRR